MGSEYTLQSQMQNELRPNEKLLWTGQPSERRSKLTMIPVVLFGVPFTLFALFWMVMASGFGQPSFGGAFSIIRLIFPLFGLPFLAVGLGMLTSPYWAARYSGKTMYAVTDQRIIIITPSLFGGRTIQSFTARDIGTLQRNELDDGSGDLIFARNTYTSYDTDSLSRTRRQQIGFFGVPDVRSVENLVLKTFKAERDTLASSEPPYPSAPPAPK